MKESIQWHKLSIPCHMECLWLVTAKEKSNWRRWFAYVCTIYFSFSGIWVLWWQTYLGIIFLPRSTCRLKFTWKYHFSLSLDEQITNTRLLFLSCSKWPVLQNPIPKTFTKEFEPYSARCVTSLFCKMLYANNAFKVEHAPTLRLYLLLTTCIM